MVKSEELRVGNWIIIDNGEKPKYYYEVTAHDIEEIEGYGEDCFPIPLTPEIVIKCGFERTSPEGWYKKGFMDLFDGNPFHYASGNNLCPDIYSLHQLQNLFFALHGEELEINLPA